MAAGGAIRLRCVVPRHTLNRALDYGIEGYTSSSRELAGDTAVIATEVIIDHVPCGVGEPFCRLTRAGEQPRRVTAVVLVAGCDGPGSP